MVQEAEFERSAGDRHGGDDAAADLLGQGDGDRAYCGELRGVEVHQIQ
jgi:hypothetical protein